MFEHAKFERGGSAVHLREREDSPEAARLAAQPEFRVVRDQILQLLQDSFVVWEIEKRNVVSETLNPVS
ncbi:MAG: hypothetical protein IPN66_06130 [Candidatus Competibacteraceae bacterium]|nr:hypothetical protein [Candidatus Competibacteraceae bacterium]